MNIAIVSRKLLKPSSPTPKHAQYFNLSLFDQIAPVTHVSMILYYPVKGEENEIQRAEKRCKLENSLSEILTHYYPFTGRFIKEDLLVDCSEQGVEYLEVEVNGSLDEFLQGSREPEVLNKFVPWDIGAPDSATTPLLSIQINMFNCGGLVIGVRFSHVIADACSMISFINGWATVSRLGIDALIRPNFSSASLFPAIKSLEIKPPVFHENEPVILMKRFVFDGMAIQDLKAKSKANGSSNNQPSRVAVVTALIWKALLTVSRANRAAGKYSDDTVAPPIKLSGSFIDERSTTSVMNMLMNLRGKTGLNLPENLFGNLCSLITTKVNGDKSNLDFHELVNVVEDAIRRAIEGSANRQNEDEILKMVIDMIRNFKGEKIVKGHAFTSWCRFPIYEADFGWGKPGWVSSAGMPAEVVLLMDHNSGDGIEAWVYLNETDMIKFQQDPDIAAFSSQSR